MKSFILANEWRIAAVVTLVATSISFPLFGPRGGFGMLMGIMGGGFNFWVMLCVGNYLGKSVKSEETIRAGTVITVMSFFLKLPLLILLGIIMRRVGGPALPCFVTAIGMVYSSAVGWGWAHS